MTRFDVLPFLSAPQVHNIVFLMENYLSFDTFFKELIKLVFIHSLVSIECNDINRIFYPRDAVCLIYFMI
jgi:hypothetical protein